LGKEEDNLGLAGKEKRAEVVAILKKSNAPPTLVMRTEIYDATVVYVQNKDLDGAGIYWFDRDVIEFNTGHSDYPTTIEGETALRLHELLHREDFFEYHSWDNMDLLTAINIARGKFVTTHKKVLSELETLPTEDQRAVHDILSALQGNMDGLKWGHDEAYWNASVRAAALEVTANIGTLDLMNGKGLDIIKRYFPEIFNAYRGMVK